MTFPLPSILLASWIMPAPDRDEYTAELQVFRIGKIRFAYWLKYV